MTSQPSNNPTTPPLPPADLTPEQESIYSALESYPWHTDAEFQSGLRAILGQPATTTTTTTPTLTPTKQQEQQQQQQPTTPQPQPQQQDPTQVKDLTLRARCFYYTRQNPTTPLDFETYKAWRDRQPPSALSSLAPIPGTELPLAAWSDSEPSSTDVTPHKAESRRRSVLSGGSGVTAFSSADSTLQGQDGTQNPGEGQQGAGDNEEELVQPRSMAEIMELIRTGQPIPGIKEIPDTVLVGQGSEATKTRRKKPWERDEAAGAPGLELFLGTTSTGHPAG